MIPLTIFGIYGIFFNPVNTSHVTNAIISRGNTEHSGFKKYGSSILRGITADLIKLVMPKTKPVISPGMSPPKIVARITGTCKIV